MLVQFNSDAYESITYFDNVAHQLLSMMGHSGIIPGALLARDIPNALQNLAQSIDDYQDITTEQSDVEDENEEPEISIKIRAVPLINMLKAAEKESSNIHWDYY